MAIEQITYEEFLKKLEAIEKRYLSDEPGFPPGAKEKGLEICRKFRREVAEIGPENCEYYIDTLYGLPMHKPIRPQDTEYVHCAHCNARISVEQAVHYKHRLIYGEHYHCRECDPKGVWDCMSHDTDMEVH